ncbi:MAG: hypothetical protein D3917_17025 [Candidatus Electrothrix sp. AX5]|nr:hypothetical protein [Candidatus Electrothrix sp. AX5]
MTNRFIKFSDIPSSLWCKKTKNIILPKKLVELWKGLLEKNNLIGLAGKIAPSGFVGGISKEDTDKHLAWRYNGSCARVLLSILDPQHKLSDVSDAYALTFAGNNVFISDLPSGSGAAIVSILCTLFELRKHNVLPRHPLNISIIAGEISSTAKTYLREQLEDLTPYLEEQAIWIEFEIVEWDILNKISTVDLIKKITISSQNATAKLLILSNFTGFLANSGNWKKAQPQLDDIFLHSRDSLSTSIWIEPQTKKVVNFFTKAIEWLKTSFSPLLGSRLTTNDHSWFAEADVFCKQPIKDGDFPVRLTVMRFDLPIEVHK